MVSLVLLHGFSFVLDMRATATVPLSTRQNVCIMYVIIKCSAMYSCQLDTFFMSQIFLPRVCVTGFIEPFLLAFSFVTRVCVTGCSAISSCVQFCTVCYWLYLRHFYVKP